MFTWHRASYSWLCLHLKINQQQKVVQIRIQVSQVEAVLSVESDVVGDEMPLFKNS